MNEIGRQTAEIQRVEVSGSGPRPLFGLSRLDTSPTAAHSPPTSSNRYSMTNGPIRFGFEANGQGWSTLLWSILVNFGVHSQKLMSRQLQTYAEVPICIPYGPRPFFGLSRLDLRHSAAHCRPTSPSRYSTTTGMIRFGFEVWGHGVADCTLVHFGELWLLIRTFAASQLETSASVPVSVPQVPRPLFGLRLVASPCLAGHCLGTSPSRNSMTTEPIWLGFEVWGSVVADCTLVHFGKLWFTNAELTGGPFRTTMHTQSSRLTLPDGQSRPRTRRVWRSS
jgi:hypothetical protein